MTRRTAAFAVAVVLSILLLLLLRPAGGRLFHWTEPDTMVVLGWPAELAATGFASDAGTTFPDLAVSSMDAAPTIDISASAGTARAFGQISPGRLAGLVTDSQGAVLPGVTVTATSPSLTGIQSTVTESDGKFMFLALPSGTYRLAFELSGFQKLIRENIQIARGQIISFDASLPIASLSESVIVTVASPVVDVVPTKLGTNLKGDELIVVPDSTDVWGALSEAPGIRTQGFAVGGHKSRQHTGDLRLDAARINAVVAAEVARNAARSVTAMEIDYRSPRPIMVRWAAKASYYHVSDAAPAANILVQALEGAGPRTTAQLDGLDTSLAAHLQFELRGSARGVVAELDNHQLNRVYRLIERLAATSADGQSILSTGKAFDETDIRTYVPVAMQVGEASTVVVRLDKRRLPTFDLPSPAEARGVIPVGDEAIPRLVAGRRDFEVSSAPPPQFVWADKATDFFFVVTPLRAGKRNLKLLLGVQVRIGNRDSVRETLIANRNIDVSHNFPAEAQQVAQVWIPIGAVLAPALLFLVAMGRRQVERMHGKRGKLGF